MRSRLQIFAVLVPLGILFAFSKSGAYAAWFDFRLGVPIRSVLASVNAKIPFSVTEAFFLLLPFLVLILILGAFLVRHPRRLLAGLFSFLLVYLGLYVAVFAAGQHRPVLKNTLEIDTAEPTAEELFGCVEWLSSLAVPPERIPSEEEILGGLRAALEETGMQYGIPANIAIRPKRTVTPLLGRLGFFGLYAFPLGEVTVTAECTGAIGSFTLAHELAHASGLSREEEADLFAFLACLDSGDSYLRYAGASGMLGRLLSALYEADPALWQSASEEIPKAAREELIGAGEVYEQSIAPTVVAPAVQYRETVLLLCGLYRSRVKK